MNPFLNEESLAIVVIVVNDGVFRAVRGSGGQLGILYLGTPDNAPANANEELTTLREEVLKLQEDPDAETFNIPGNPPGAPPQAPWILTIYWRDGDDLHLWIARDFQPMNVPSAGERNTALMIFQPDAPDPPADIDNAQSLADIREFENLEPERVYLYATQPDAQMLGQGAGDYGSARDLDA